MVIKTCRWSPDTCDCILEYEWDDNGNDQEIKTHTFTNAHRVGKEHEAVSTGKGNLRVYEVCQEENSRKNIFYKHLIEQSTDFGETVQDRNGETITRLKPTINFDFTYTGTDGENRTLEVLLRDNTTRQTKPITQADKTRIDTELTKNGIDPAKIVLVDQITRPDRGR